MVLALMISLLSSYLLKYMGGELVTGDLRPWHWKSK